MKKCIIIVLLLLTYLTIPPTSIHGQTSLATPTAPMTASIAYDIPSPTILPDNPWYTLQVLKEKIILFFISDPDKKAEQHLKSANSQITMSKLLIDKGNIQLARETALKGEHQMTLMTFVFKNASRSPKKEFLSEVQRATQKHQEILSEIIKKVSKEDAEIFSTIVEFSQRNVDQMGYLMSEADEKDEITPTQ